MQPDIEKYLPYLDSFDMSEEEKVAYIQNVWHMMETFVDEAWASRPPKEQ